MELVTGKAGTNHISGADLAAMYRGLLIADDVVLATGDKLSCTMTDANTAEIGTGDCMIQAHHCRVEVAEQVTIESGASGYNRNDLIVARYTLGDGGIQSVYLAVVKGTAVAGEASDPSYAEGSIDGGDVLVEFPLWRIPLTGVSVGDPERIMPTVDTLQKQVTDLRESVTRKHEYTEITTQSGTVQFVNVDKLCILYAVDMFNGVGHKTLTTLSEEYRPKTVRHVPAIYIQGQTPGGKLSVDTDGKVNLDQTGTSNPGAYISGLLVWVAGM